MSRDRRLAATRERSRRLGAPPPASLLEPLQPRTGATGWRSKELPHAGPGRRMVILFRSPPYFTDFITFS
jgi:hypothetical protein